VATAGVLEWRCQQGENLLIPASEPQFLLRRNPFRYILMFVKYQDERTPAIQAFIHINNANFEVIMINNYRKHRGQGNGGT
jgi:hypothetical protein